MNCFFKDLSKADVWLTLSGTFLPWENIASIDLVAGDETMIDTLEIVPAEIGSMRALMAQVHKLICLYETNVEGEKYVLTLDQEFKGFCRDVMSVDRMAQSEEAESVILPYSVEMLAGFDEFMASFRISFPECFEVDQGYAFEIAYSPEEACFCAEIVSTDGKVEVCQDINLSGITTSERATVIALDVAHTFKREHPGVAYHIPRPTRLATTIEFLINKWSR